MALFRALVARNAARACRGFIARGSAYETIYWTSRASELLPKDAEQRANEVARLVNALINAHKGAGNRA
jgi:hypothetical protein